MKETNLTTVVLGSSKRKVATTVPRANEGSYVEEADPRRLTTTTTTKTDTVRVNIEKMLEQLSRPARLDGYSIYRVPASVRDSVDNKHYEPRLVSIGPYHRSKHHLRAMEDRKRLYLLRFLHDQHDDDDGSGRRDGLLQDCVGRVRKLEARARACYFESPATGDGEDDDDMFVEMLLLDGCFVVQLFIQWFCGATDPVFDVGWNLPLLHTDLLMLENQIPYFVLLALYDAYSHDPNRPPSARPKPSLTTIITSYFSEKEGRQPATTTATEDAIDHLLHLYHSTFVMPPPDHLPAPVQADCGGKLPRTIRCAKELTMHGVKFVRKPETTNVLDVTFCRDTGVFQIPRVAIEDSTCIRYMNLVAFEQCRGEAAVAEKHLTSYVVLMDYLINTAEDVVILDRADVMENKLANEEEAAKFFNQLRLSSYINYDDHYLAPVYRDVDAFCRRKWPKYKAKFRRDYLNSPWAIFGFCLATTFAVITLFNTIVTILQTFFHLFK
ncbi:hypothetical protein [Oryza sativa Japonica Group]|uniref:Os01g0319200 protein n=3 Tax=Oryza TaxID=4527 RepID=Q94D69_ORYSJ|nr:hypothetical protein [Oryza sativa Japonica Group]BAF04801.1 Os01g0319200 [Oryza sativa Japonica Group]|eukprot:NP_001042887.1 Os01g0319200 [Oryza sativa Japonica Group]